MHAVDTTILGLITGRDETAYRDETLSEWCNKNSLSININKTKETIVDFKRLQKNCYTPYAWGSGVAGERGRSIKFLCVHLTADLNMNLSQPRK